MLADSGPLERCCRALKLRRMSNQHWAVRRVLANSRPLGPQSTVRLPGLDYRGAAVDAAGQVNAGGGTVVEFAGASVPYCAGRLILQESWPTATRLKTWGRSWRCRIKSILDGLAQVRRNFLPLTGGKLLDNAGVADHQESQDRELDVARDVGPPTFADKFHGRAERFLQCGLPSHSTL